MRSASIGYEIYVAGNGGIKTEAAEFPCTMSDEEVSGGSAPSRQLGTRE